MKPLLKIPDILAITLPLLACVTSLKAEVPAEILGAVAGSDQYELIYEAEIPDLAPQWVSEAEYVIDNSGTSPTEDFDRVAYIMELDENWVWVSYDTLVQAQELSSIGVPSQAAIEEPIQTKVTNMDVFSNIVDAGIVTTGTGMTGGNIEFWFSNYNESNPRNVPNASGAAFDWGDGGATSDAGYGSMQVHNHDASQVIFAFNRWGNGTGGTEIGIGNNPGGNIDYTFAENGADYTTRNLYVLVRAGTPGPFPSPALTSSVGSLAGNKIVLKFSEPLVDSSADAGNFSIVGGPAVTDAELTENDTIVLTTAQLTAGTTYMLNYTCIEGLPGAAPKLNDTLTVEVTAPAFPELLETIAEAEDYELIYHAEIPEAAPAWGNGASYMIDESKFSTATVFDRVAYVMELGGEWVFVSFDKLSQANRLSAIGVPTVDVVAGVPIQTNVANMDVASSLAGITKGTGLTGGNIEFWPGNYNGANDANIPNASPDTFDFGDGGPAAGTGYGSMQVHNHNASEVLFAFNRWGSGFAGTTDIGIGTNAVEGQNPDYTFAENAANFATRNLYVLVRPFQGTPFDGILASVPDSGDYELIYQAEVPDLAPSWGEEAEYVVDNSETSPTEDFDRVAYVMELDENWVWVSYETIIQATTLASVGVPSQAAIDAPIQTNVNNMDVYSNMEPNLITTGTGLPGGNIEFWFSNYGAGNARNVPNASGGTFDWGDGGASTTPGYGSMQVHNHDASQVIFAFNRWGGAGGGTEIGIGTNTVAGQNPDYTFAENGAEFEKRNLYVLVRPGTPGPFESPQLESVIGSLAGDQLLLKFSETLVESSANMANFSIAGGLVITGVRLIDDTIILTTAQQTAGTSYTVNYTGVEGLPGEGIKLTETLTREVVASTRPAFPDTIPATQGYELIYHAEIPEQAPAWGNGATYLVDESAFSKVGSFDRVGYLMELDGEWIFVSFDKLDQARKLSAIGIPTVDVVDGTPIQASVENMNVASSLAGITKGTGLTGGNIEFWPGNYNGANDANIPNASPDTFDFGDGGPATNTGYGSMQIHNHEASEVLFAFNRWGSGFAGTTDIGIGTNTVEGQNPDYTFAENAASFATRNLYILVRPGIARIPAEIAAQIPESGGFQLVYELEIPAVNEFGGDAVVISDAYNVDNSIALTAGPQVAYLMVLDDEWVWVSFDAFTEDLTLIGIPHMDAWPEALQQIVTNMNIVTNASAEKLTPGLYAEGNIEFWGGNYSQANALGIENADDGTFDFGDTMSGGGHGSMQVHSFMSSEVVFAYNNWGSNNGGAAGGLGIGNNLEGANPDYTFQGSSINYDSRRLYVLTGAPGGGIPFQITSVVPNLATNEVTITWSSVEGQTFGIGWSDTLEGDFEELDDGVEGEEGSTSFVDTVPAGTRVRYYQVFSE
ncbi:MAG: hypothetical protein ACI9R3_001151 [Verrucomicrobiales bacterium]|jgi:hypothetical protein